MNTPCSQISYVKLMLRMAAFSACICVQATVGLMEHILHLQILNIGGEHVAQNVKLSP